MISQIVAYFAVAVAGVWTLRSPVIGLGVYYVLALARPQDIYWWWGETHLSYAIGAVVCGVWLLAWIQGSHGGPGKSPVNILFFGLLMFKAISAMLAADQTAAWYHMEKVAKMALLYFVTVSLVDTKERFRWLTLVMAASLAFLGLWGNWQWYVEGVGGGLLGELAGPGWERGGAIADRNLFAYMLTVGMPVCFFVFFIESAPGIRWLALGCIPLLANAVMLSFSRAAFLAMVIGSFWAVLRLRRVVPMLGFGVLGVLMLCRLVGSEVAARVMTIQEYDQDSSAQERLETWKAGFRMMGEHPLLGVGAGNYGRYSSLYNPNVREGQLTHNEFIETAAETGIPAGLMLLAIFALAVWKLRRIQKATWLATETRWAYYSAAMLESAFVCYIIGAMFVSLPYFELSYLLLALTVSLARIVEKTAAEPRNWSQPQSVAQNA